MAVSYGNPERQTYQRGSCLWASWYGFALAAPWEVAGACVASGKPGYMARGVVSEDEIYIRVTGNVLTHSRTHSRWYRQLECFPVAL